MRCDCLIVAVDSAFFGPLDFLVRKVITRWAPKLRLTMLEPRTISSVWEARLARAVSDLSAVYLVRVLRYVILPVAIELNQRVIKRLFE